MASRGEDAQPAPEPRVLRERAARARAARARARARARTRARARARRAAARARARAARAAPAARALPAAAQRRHLQVSTTTQNDTHSTSIVAIHKQTQYTSTYAETMASIWMTYTKVCYERRLNPQTTSAIASAQ